MLAASRGWGANWGFPRRIAKACAYWATRVKAAREIPSATENYLEVRHKDLYEGGASALQAIFDWCGVEMSDAGAAEIFEQYRIDSNSLCSVV